MDSNNFKPILFCSILDYGKGSKMLKLSKELGGVGETIFIGRGTLRNEWLNILGVEDIRKEVFITIINEELEDIFYKEVSKRFALERRHHGIAFSMPLKYFITGKEKIGLSDGEKGVSSVSKIDFESIFVIVDKGSLDDVLDAAEAAGSTGGTVIHGRGSGSKEKAKLFNIEIEPEKEILLILSQVSNTEKIVNSIKDKLDIHKPNAGIIFVMDVSRTLGLYKG